MTMKKTMLLALALMLWAAGAFAATITVPTDFGTIEAALTAALPGDTVYILDGTYTPVGTLYVNQAQTVTGQSESGVLINIPAAGGYGFSVASHDVILENFTLVANVGNINYPIHASGTGNPANGYDNLTIQNVTISGAHQRTGFDVHGYNTVVLSHLTSSDATGGNGLQITGCIDVVMNNITTSNNTWGSIAIYSSSSSYLNRGSDNVAIDGTTLSLGEQNLYNQDEFGLFNTNIVVSGYGYMVRNIFAPGYTFYKDTETDAVTAALASPGSYIIDIADGRFLVASGMSIQIAIDAASAGDDIVVGVGHYEEQLHVTTDNLSILGAGVDATYIDSPPTLALSFATGTNNNFPVVFVDHADGVNFADMTLDGLNRGTANYRFQGFGYFNSGGSLTNVDVDNIMDTTFSGAQHGNGIYCITDDGGPHAFDMMQISVDDFQKTGVVISGAGLTATMDFVSATGQGQTTITAQNGIQVSGGASATSSNCSVQNIHWIGTPWAASGFLGVSGTNWDLNNCTADNVQVSIWLQDTSGSVDGCTVTNSTFDAMYVTSWAAKSSVNSTRGLAQPFDSGTKAPNKGTVNVSLANSSFTGASPALVDTWGVSPYGDDVVNCTMTNCEISQFDWGYVVYDFGGATLTTVAHDNTIFDNLTYDGFSNAVTVQDAEANYWGSLDPTAKISGTLDFSPWYGLALGTVPMTLGTNDSVQDAINLANSGDTVNVMPGTYVEAGQILVDKDINIIGDPGNRPIIMTDSDTGNSGDPRGWFLQTAGTHLELRNLELDGAGYLVYQGIRSHGSGVLDNCALRNITYNESGPTYGGVALAAFGAGNWDVTGCTFDNIGRIGFLAFGTGLSNSSFSGNTYTGKGVGDWLDYACDISAGAVMTVENNTITACQGVASSDGSTSAGLLISTYFAPGTTMTLNDNIITGNSTGVACGYDALDTSVVVGRGNNLSGNDTYGVSNSAPNIVDFLHNWWGDASGPFHPTLNPAGTGNEVDDNILFEPWTGMAIMTVAPSTSGPLVCGQNVTLTFNLTMDAYTPDVFGFNAMVRATSEVDWNGITNLNVFGGTTQFLTFDNGDGSFMISGTTQGSPTQPISGAGTYGLFEITFTTAADGTADITFDSFSLRDPANQPIAASPTGATIDVDCMAPTAVADITAAPHHDKVALTWSHDNLDTDHYEIYRGLWYDTTVGTSAYPEYDDLANDVIPTRPGSRTAAQSNTEWELAGTVLAGVFTFDDIGPFTAGRGVYYYEVFAVDAALPIGNNPLAAAANDRATNYWLGDVSGDGHVTPVDDIDVLANTFGLTDGTTGYNNLCDVGPTDDWSRVGIPTTDNSIDFEDLMVFTMNFGVVTDTNKDLGNISTTAGLAWVEAGEGQYALRLVDGVGIKGVHLRANLPEGSLGRVTAGQLLDSQSEMTFMQNIGNSLDVSLAVMGQNNGFIGTGDLLIVNSSTPIMATDLAIEVRGYDNSDVQFTLDETTGTVTPRVFALNANYPNPFNPMTKISFSLPEAQDVRLNVYGIDGAKVATLINETRSAGLHEIIWNGRNDVDQTVASGMYFYRIEAGPYSQVRKMTLMK